MYYHEDDRAQRLFDVFEVLDGDHDGDKVAIAYFDDDSIRKPLIKLSKSKV